MRKVDYREISASVVSSKLVKPFDLASSNGNFSLGKRTKEE